MVEDQAAEIARLRIALDEARTSRDQTLAAVLMHGSEVVRLRCVLADIEVLADDLAEARRMATDALAPSRP